MRLEKAGHVLLDTTFDKPWAQYFCCLVTGRRDFVNNHPIAAKRALRAFLKAADICATQPEQVARFLQKKGIEPRYEVSLDVLTRLPYHHWRDWNVEDTLRFHALRLKDVGMIRSTPNDLIARCTDQRFLSELKREMKA
jgi:NitT/TauT family transport system substrate-binding protein